MNEPTPDDVPGFAQAVMAVRAVGGVLLPAEAAIQLVTVVAAVLRPHLTAEVYADLADDEVLTSPQLDLSRYFDSCSHHIRESLNAV